MRIRTQIFLLCATLLNGCMFFDLKEDLELFDLAVTLSGSVENVASIDAPVLIALYVPEGRGNYRLVAFTVRYGSSDFEFTVEPGAYYLVAFQDRNEDFVFQETENVGWYGKPALLTTRPGDRIVDLKLALRAPAQARTELPIIYELSQAQVPLKLENSRLGEVVKPDESLFSQEIGDMGIWEPVKHVLQGYSGIFFLEPYAPEKIPVVFIHGMGGSGHNWLDIVERLDKSRFQAWIVQYPSGMRLGLMSRAISDEITKLRIRHGFEKMAVVAHSMGGLVARGFINRNVIEDAGSAVRLFVTLSTPWAGHASARLGVDNAPVIVPSWYDLVPNSVYIESLFANPLPENIPYYLFFSHRGDRNLLSQGNTDGAVALSSQLYPAAQDRAVRQFGYNEDHISILSSPSVSSRLNELLLSIGRPEEKAATASFEAGID